MMTYFLLVWCFVLIQTCCGSRIRDQTPQWGVREPLRVICPENKGKARCFQYCFNRGLLSNITWLESNCLPNLQYKDAFFLERRREFVAKWAYATYLGDPDSLLYFDIRNTTLRQDVLAAPEHVVRFFLVTAITTKSLLPGPTYVYDATSLPADKKVFIPQKKGQYAIQELTTADLLALPSVLHPRHPVIGTYALGMERYANNLTQALLWHWSSFPDELIVEIESGTLDYLYAVPYFDVTERVQVQQTDKCQAFPSCSSCQTEVNCEWCVLPNHTHACTGFCRPPWTQNVCGALAETVLGIFSLVLLLLA
eukprot:Gregarina_sp_Poly_1__1577@NODE_139_length_13109_cov_53_487809_g124_i0_p6_GENE_NODE_139_length_13109_cov_53_487809_g124_i0NODE_139_length_13109_cov_53_487809_g124_i0_p6_ORF_typecomplete_len310_score25_80_NODE_139_length_13109_cov_53_487809_g124_i031474076